MSGGQSPVTMSKTMKLKSPNNFLSNRKSVNYTVVSNKNSEQLREII